MVLFITVVPSTSHAADEVPQPSYTDVLTSTMRGFGSPCNKTECDATGYGIYWDTPSVLSPSVVAFSLYDRPEATNAQDNAARKRIADDVICTGIADPLCAPRPNSRLAALSTLGLCLSDAELGCIESVRLRIGSSSLADLEFISYAGPATAFDESVTNSVPRGSSLSRWRAQDGSDYIVSAVINSAFSSDGTSWKQMSRTFNLSVSRIARASTITTKTATTYADPLYAPYKIWVNSGLGGIQLVEFAPDTRVEVGVRLPNTINGWFTARLSGGTVAARPLSGNRTSYTFGGDATSTFVAGAASRSTTFPAGFIRETHGNDYKEGTIFQPTPDQIKTYDKYSPYLGDRALGSPTRWTISGTSWSTTGCFSAGSGIGAILGTNAAVYNGGAPTWNDKDKTLSFQVASPHYDDKGAVARGTYSLSLPSASVKCLYGAPKLPSFVQVSVTSDTDGQQFVSTSNLNESNGWVNFSASGFHFSNPRIVAKFSNQQQVPTSSYTVKTAGTKATLSIRLPSRQVVKIYRVSAGRRTLIRTLNGRKGLNSLTTPFKKTYSFIVKDSRGQSITQM